MKYKDWWWLDCTQLKVTPGKILLVFLQKSELNWNIYGTGREFGVLKNIFGGLFAFIWIGQLEIWQEGVQRERGWHAANEPQAGGEPAATAEDW